MSKKKRKEKEQNDLVGCLTALIAVPVFAILAYMVFIKPNQPDGSGKEDSYTYTAPEPSEVATRKCLSAVKRKYAASGYDAVKLASQRISAFQNEDGDWVSNISVPFGHSGDRVFWINVECRYDGETIPVITEKDTAGAQ